tara:strand:+ start:185 stop:1054 length:870 start_codon:yes stop_codon:yes gene_type:complete
MNNLSDDELGRKYLLYLRDMSRKLIYSSSSSTAGNYSSILILNRRTNDELIYSRITDWNLDILRRKEKGGYKLEAEQLAKGNGIFCAIGIVSGVVWSSKRKAPKLISAPLVYGQIQFESSGESQINEWLINYDLATELLHDRDDGSTEDFFSLESSGLAPAEVVRDLQDRLDLIDLENINQVKEISNDYLNFLVDSLRIDISNSPSPLISAKKAFNLKETIDEKFRLINKQKENLTDKEKKLIMEECENLSCLTFVSDDWIFSAPVPEGLNTYSALQDLSRILSMEEAC